MKTFWFCSGRTENKDEKNRRGGENREEKSRGRRWTVDRRRIDGRKHRGEE